MATIMELVDRVMFSLRYFQTTMRDGAKVGGFILPDYTDMQPKRKEGAKVVSGS